MKNLFFYLLLTAPLFNSYATSGSQNNYIQSLQTPPQNGLLEFRFEEQLNKLGHLSEPWATSTYTGKGVFWIDSATFLKQDTLVNSRGRFYTSTTDFQNDTLLYLDYGDLELMPITKELYFEKLINTARYSPLIVFEYFTKNVKDISIVVLEKTAVSSMKIGSFVVKLSRNMTTLNIEEISYLSNDELYGDVETSFSYSEYQTENGFTYPTKINIDKINGKVKDVVTILKMNAAADIFNLLEKPVDYQFVESKAKIPAKIEVTKYTEYIHFINLEHTDDRVLVVEFDDYMLVAEAPLNSENGELIIAEVKKIAPLKPIKYFVFGHHHPHYLGGLRAFIHKGATVLCTEISQDYVSYIAKAPHSLNPDSLQLQPKTLKAQLVSDSFMLKGNTEMRIYFIGDKSAHTKDYLIYYFPKEKLLFQDDLCAIPKEGWITKAGPRQIGLYNAIKDLGLNVETIVQSWPVNSSKVKTTFPFADLQKSMQVEK